MSEPIIIHTAVTRSSNPVPGGYAAMVEHPKHGQMTITGGAPYTTSNRMEIAAVIEALRVINATESLNDAPITVRSSSRYLAKTFNANRQKTDYKPAENRDLWQDLLKQADRHPVTWIQVIENSGDPHNKECHRLAAAQIPAARAALHYWCIVRHPTASEKTGKRTIHPNSNDPKELLKRAAEALDSGSSRRAAAITRKALTLLEK